MKALEKDRNRRYETANAFAADVQRYLADEPVQAGPPSAWYRFGKFARRNKAGLAFAGVVLLILLTVAGSIGWMLAARAQRLALIRQLAEERTAAAHANVQAGRLDEAAKMLAEALGICQPEPTLAALHDRVSQQLQQLDQFRRFRELAKKILADGTHGFGARQRPDDITQRCEVALALYHVIEDESWEGALTDTILSPEQVSEVKALVAQLLTTIAIRQALYDTKDEAGKDATRQALALLDRVETIGGPSHAVWLLRWRYQRRLGNHKAADYAGDQMEKAKPKTALDFYLLGSIATQVLKDPKRGLASYDRALALEPNHYGAQLGRYFAFQKLKDGPGQMGALNVAIALRPEETLLYYFRGFGLFEMKDYARAYVDFDTLVRRDPKNKDGHYWRGRVNFIFGSEDKEKLVEAEQDFSCALEIDPSFSSPYQWRAITRAKLNRPQDAVPDAETALRLHDTKTTPWYVARAYALSSRAVLADGQNPKRQLLAEQYGRRAVELLREAVKRGFIKKPEDVDSFRLSTDLDPLRSRPDFQKLLSEIEKKFRPVVK